MQKWEYTVVSLHTSGSEKVLIVGRESQELPEEGILSVANKLGDEGWEMVSGNFDQGQLINITCFFKRPKKDKPGKSAS